MAMEYNFQPISLTEFNAQELAALAKNLRNDTNLGTTFLNQQLPQYMLNLRATEQALNHKTRVMLEDALVKYETLQKYNQIGAANQDELNQLLAIIKAHYPKTFNEAKHMMHFTQQLLTVTNQVGQMFQGYGQQQISTIRSYFQQFSHMHDQLSKRSILVVKQPDEVIKKLNQFDTHVVLLVKDVPQGACIRIRIITASDAEQLKSGSMKCSQIPPSATLLNNQGALTENNGCLQSQFTKKPSLKDISSRAHTNGGKRLTVAEQKYVVLYELVLSTSIEKKLGHSETLWALSLPIVLIVHANQLTDAFATIVWDRLVGSEVETDWTTFARLLKIAFKHISSTSTRNLSDEDLLYFYKKLDIQGNTVTFQKFAKDKITSEFTFWAWFESIAQLIKNKLSAYWEKGYIMGFSTKEEISTKINYLNSAAFLLRFSDSQLGKVSVSTFRHDSSGQMIHAPYLLPTEKMGPTDSFIDLLRDFDEIRHIRYICNMSYGLIDKAIVFADPVFNAKTNSSNGAPDATGYHKLKTVIRGESADDVDGRQRSDSVSSSATSSSVMNPSASASVGPYSPGAYPASVASNASACYATDGTPTNGTPQIPMNDQAFFDHQSYTLEQTSVAWPQITTDPAAGLQPLDYDLNPNLGTSMLAAMESVDMDCVTVYQQHQY